MKQHDMEQMNIPLPVMELHEILVHLSKFSQKEIMLCYNLEKCYNDFTQLCKNPTLIQTEDDALVASNPNRYTNRMNKNWLYDKNSEYDHFDEQMRAGFRFHLSKLLFAHLN